MSGYLVVRVAHRGASGLCPENTRLAFERAIALGVDLIELDVHLTRDGQLAVIHDDRLERTTNGAGYVRDHTAAQLRQLDAGLGEPVPLLSEVLRLAEAGGVRLCVEAKGADEAETITIAEALVAALAAADWIHRALLTSFVPAALRRARTLGPRLATMLDPSPQDGSLTPRMGNSHPNVAPYEVFPTKDGHMVLAVGTDNQYQKFCASVERPDLAEDPAYRTNGDRIRNRRTLSARITEIIGQKPTEAWLAIFGAVGVPCGQIHTLDQVYDHPQVQHREMMMHMDHALAGARGRNGPRLHHGFSRW